MCVGSWPPVCVHSTHPRTERARLGPPLAEQAWVKVCYLGYMDSVSMFCFHLLLEDVTNLKCSLARFSCLLYLYRLLGLFGEMFSIRLRRMS